MRVILAVSALLALAASAASAAPMTYEVAGRTTCGSVPAAARDPDFGQAVTGYVRQFGGGRLGETCSVIGYIEAACQGQPRTEIKDVISSLLYKARNNQPLPKIKPCGS